LILSFVNPDRTVISTSFDLRNKFRRLFHKIPKASILPIEWAKVIDDIVFGQFKIYRIGHYLRMTVERQGFIGIKGRSLARTLSLSDKNILLGHCQLCERGRNFQADYWKRKTRVLNEGRSIGVVRSRKLLSFAEIEPMDCGGGNIIVSTSEKHRRKGYGKAAVAAAVKWCFDHDVRPIYYVRTDNTASIALAKGLGFKAKNREIIVEHWPGDAEDKYKIKV
jgi:GNAT superfamily N-acetyltransferase